MLSWLELDSAGFVGNIGAFRNILQPETKVMVVVKANAYGHGLLELVARAAEATDWLGVNTMAEAETVAATANGKPIAILGYSQAENAQAIVRNGFRQVVYRLDIAEALSRAAVRLG